MQVAAYRSAPYAQQARLVLKVSLNLGANLGVNLFGLTKGATTMPAALHAERAALVADFGIDPGQIDFPTNGSGTPDSRATPRVLVTMLAAMAKTAVAEDFRAALPTMGVDASLAHTGSTLPGKGHVHAKPGTTVGVGADGKTLELQAQNMAGYIETKSGRTIGYALMVNNAGPVTDIATDVSAVFEDEGVNASLIYEKL